jgi:two-component sensor histidine kinase
MISSLGLSGIYLNGNFVSDENITFNVDVDPVRLDIGRAAPLGLIISELIAKRLPK